jgi:hypothetical protein
MVSKFSFHFVGPNYNLRGLLKSLEECNVIIAGDPCIFSKIYVSKIHF